MHSLRGQGSSSELTLVAFKLGCRWTKEGELGLLSHNNQSYYSKYLIRCNCHTHCFMSAALQRLPRSYTSLLVIPGCCGRTYANQLFLIKHKKNYSLLSNCPAP